MIRWPHVEPAWIPEHRRGHGLGVQLPAVAERPRRCGGRGRRACLTAATPSLWAAEVTHVAATALSWPQRRGWAAERVTVHALGWPIRVPGCDPRAWWALSLGQEDLSATSPSPRGGRPGPLTRGVLWRPACPPRHLTSRCSVFPEGSPPCHLSCPSPAPGLLSPPCWGAVRCGRLPGGVCPPLPGCCLPWSSPGRCVSAPLPGGLFAAVFSQAACEEQR